MQALLHMVYPPQCVMCDCLVTSDFGLCPSCWRDTPILIGLGCDSCGAPLAGEDPGHPLHCDDCLQRPRPWAKGRAAMLYDGHARGLVLRLKHGDRMDLARLACRFMARAVADIVTPDMMVAPIPLHWLRLLGRRYNQAALLSKGVATIAGLDHLPDLLRRRRATPSQGGLGVEDRFANLAGVFHVPAARRAALAGRHVLLVDDVMTSGATFSSATQACLAAGAARVSVLSLCRVAKPR